ncbi:MAG: flagellar hook-associated protein FlgK [Halioglobus sp.]|nr:flagellar hook-associated protein FlgK [Halioglobus sp.]
MADLLNIGSSALLSLQRAISTTGHNIANANTEGFSRQRVNLETQPPEFAGGNFVGNGVRVDSVERFYDQFLSVEVRERTSLEARSGTLNDLTSRLDQLIADPSTGLAPVIDRFFGAVQDVATNPSSLPERQVLLGEARVLADRFHDLDSNFRNLDAELNGRIGAVVADINALSESIASLNGQISRATARSQGNPPNDLLDQRDQLVNELARRIDVTVVEESSGSVNVMIGNGQPLVVGNTARAIQTGASAVDSSRLVVGVANASGAITDLGRFLRGGELGGLLDFREQVLDPARNQLGLVATGITAVVNDQHRLGMDLQGSAGGDFFTPLQAAVGAFSSNSGLSSASVSIDNAAALTGDEYTLRFDGGLWTLTNRSTGSTQTGGGPFNVDGLEISVSGTPSNGDAFIIQPTRQNAALFDLALDNPRRVAAASPLRSDASLGNAGDVSIDGLSVTDASGLPLSAPVSLSFNPDALGPGVPGFDVAGAAGGPLAYDPASEGNGKSFTLGGFEFTVSGTPQTGDTLTVVNNTNGSGDNRNALALAGLQTSNTLLGGSASFQDTYGNMVADIGVQARQAQSNSRTDGVLLEQAVADRESVAGVNLDEEAANLIRFQQAYQGAAQVIAVADQLFQTLLAATRR